ncbi:MAG: chemotaxis protein CheW, partial [Gemmatimonadetes bacterium]|nr:chemotaxis protein CheW [Gemmatimonadota bacterium]
MNADRLAARLLKTFLTELDDQLQAMNADLLALEATPGNPERLRALFRNAHTLKGAAHAAGVPLIEEVCHQLESLLAEARDAGVALGSHDLTQLFAAADALADAGARVRAGEPLESSPLAALAEVLRGPREPSPVAPAERAAAAQLPAQPPVATAPPVAHGEPTTAPARPGEQVRVDARKLDVLLAATGELLIASGHVDERLSALRSLHEFAARWAQGWARVRAQLGRIVNEGDLPPGLRDQLEAVEGHLRHLKVESARLASPRGGDARSLSRVTSDISNHVRDMRMRPFSDVCQALPRTVRDVAMAAGKQVRLEVSGSEVEADRAVLDAIREPLLHLVRNAVDHGIEGPVERERAGKPPLGTVWVSAALRGDRLVITVADDGGGVDLHRVSEQVARRSLPVPAEPRELARMIFAAGLSTRQEATTVSGRGVGLDIVRSAVEQLRGAVDVAVSEGAGTTFTIECPTSLATVRAVLVGVGPHVMAIPTDAVEHLARVRPEEVRRAGGRDVILGGQTPVPLLSLARLLGPPLVEVPLSGAALVVRLHAGGGGAAVAVDALLGEQEIVVRSLERVRTLPRFITGAALLGTGKVALILNPGALVTAGLETSGSGLSFAAPEREPSVARRVLVVDDSITTRTLGESILE